MEPSLRLILRLAAKVLGSIALLAWAYVLVSSAFDAGGNKTGTEQLTIDLSKLPPGEVQQVKWSGRLVLVLHRSGAMIDALEQSNPALLDPNSSGSHQPKSANIRFRSLSPEYLVVLGHGTDLGCPVEWADAGARGAPQPWHGGFRDRCGGSWYDLAGRVYNGQAANRNLTVPPHHFSGETLLHLD